MSFNTIIDWNGCSADQQQQLLTRPAISASDSISKTVTEILNNVKANGDAALREMVPPGMLAVLAPVIVGFFLGPVALGGMLLGALLTGVVMALLMANAGGAWDNAKKAIEGGELKGERKGGDAHAAAVIGDTVGDPFKDTSGPAMNILVKLLSVVSLILVPFIT